ncbi:jg15830 [Pararge aegeria aegeria]|uniref:Jg15830 protein n=1 Tax=Pararge aegeria aegeria TaxID=348720 RepID=A0A8S4SNG3_9NEOP|nr:jg15830 [Pararge aegeria aegeria]
MSTKIGLFGTQRYKKRYDVTKVMKFSLDPFYSFGNREKEFLKPYASVFAIPDIVSLHTSCKRAFDSAWYRENGCGITSPVRSRDCKINAP